jgi:hypothetical protein
MPRAFKLYFSPEAHIEDFEDDDEYEDDEVLEYVDVVKGLLGDDFEKSLYPVYAKVGSKADVHKPNKYNEFIKPDSMEGSRGGFSTIGYDSLLPKEEAIKQMAERIKEVPGDMLYEVKMDPPVDLNEQPELDEHRLWPEEYVSPRVNPVKRHAPKEINPGILPEQGSVPKITDPDYEQAIEKNTLLNNEWLASPDAAKALFKAGLRINDIDRMRKKALEYQHAGTPLTPKTLKYWADRTLMDRLVDELARDYYNKKDSISDEAEKDIVSKTTA